MNIMLVNTDNREEAKRFVKNEWKIFDEENNCIHKERKFEIIIKDSEKIIGYALYKVLGGTIYLGQIIVKKNQRNKGVGKILLDYFEKHGTKLRCHRAFLETSEIHKEAIKFYKSNNYKVLAVMPKHKFNKTWYLFAKELKI